jgi:hypothetical protein
MVVSVPRQSGKTTLAVLLCIDRCLARDGVQVWYTAQSRMDAVLRFRELVRVLRSSSLVERRVHAGWSSTDQWDFRVRAAAGAEEVEFVNGSQLRIFAPQEDSLHGSVTDLVVLDEARFLSAARGEGLMGAVLPTQATRDGQVWILSTAGDPDSMFLSRQVELARAAVTDPAARVGIAEWGVGDDVAAGDLLAAVWAAHPAAGLPGGPVFDALAVAAEQMPAAQFAHEYGNRWLTAADVRIITPTIWAQTTSGDPLPPGAPVFAADIAPDRSEATIVACVDSTLEVVEHRPGAGWVPARLVELARAWDAPLVVVDAAGPAGTVADQLRPILDRLIVTGTRELQAACAGFYDALTVGTVTHRPNAILDQAATLAQQRTVGQAWVWSRLDYGQALIAASLAWWGAGRVELLEVEAPAIY